VEEHFKRCWSEYKKLPNVISAWVINFTTRQSNQGYVWPENKDKIRVAHVWHDLNWNQATITFDNAKDKPIQIKLR